MLKKRVQDTRTGIKMFLFVLIFSSLLLGVADISLSIEKDGDKPHGLKLTSITPDNEFSRYMGKSFSEVLKKINIVSGKGPAPEQILPKDINFPSTGGWELRKPPRIYFVYMGPELAWSDPELTNIGKGLQSAEFGVNDKGIIDFIHYEYNIFEFTPKKRVGVYASYLRSTYRKKDVIGLDSYKALPKENSSQVFLKSNDKYLWFLVMDNGLRTNENLVGDSWFFTHFYAVKKDALSAYADKFKSVLKNDPDFCKLSLEPAHEQGYLTDDEFDVISDFLYKEKQIKPPVQLPVVLTEFSDTVGLSKYGWGDVDKAKNKLFGILYDYYLGLISATSNEGYLTQDEVNVFQKSFDGKPLKYIKEGDNEQVIKLPELVNAWENIVSNKKNGAYDDADVFFLKNNMLETITAESISQIDELHKKRVEYWNEWRKKRQP
ncbi:MAG: hypothetical protein NT099_06195 [Candidatus Saganbacteria bacterium]|nr:hypothetical protein [Candidatus Saganbacteria bacterium]